MMWCKVFWPTYVCMVGKFSASQGQLASHLVTSTFISWEINHEEFSCQLNSDRKLWTKSCVFKPRARQLILTDGEVNKRVVGQRVRENVTVAMINVWMAPPAHGRQSVLESIQTFRSEVFSLGHSLWCLCKYLLGQWCKDLTANDPVNLEACH